MEKKVIRNTNCCVYGCHSKKSKNPDISFHSFPKKGERKVSLKNSFGGEDRIDQHKAWKIKLKILKPANKSMKVCSLHFQKEDYFLFEYTCKHPTLRKNVVPSLNLPNTNLVQQDNSSREERRINRAEKKLLGNTSCADPEDLKVTNKLTKEEHTAVDSLLHLVNISETLPASSLPSISTQDQGIQVTSGDIKISFSMLINSNAKLNSLTGLPTFALLDKITLMLTRAFPDKCSHKLSLKERVILTFMKMKTAITYVILSALFDVTSTTCKSIFYDTITMLAHVLQAAIPWRSQVECLGHLANFSNTRVVLGCTEIPVEKPKCLSCRINTYSQYKGKHTIKFLTAASPSCLITFISEAHGGMASDKAIFEQSGVIKKLKMVEDAIMVGRDFRINEISNSCGIKFHQPPFFYKVDKQFTEEEAKLNPSIASARVHMERLNNKIKLFNIFNSTLPWTLVPKIDEIFRVACAIVNLTSPVLADDKFI